MRIKYHQFFIERNKNEMEELIDLTPQMMSKESAQFLSEIGLNLSTIDTLKSYFTQAGSNN